MKDMLLGALLTSAITTEKGRQISATIGKIGLAMLEQNLKKTYGIDVDNMLNPKSNEESEEE